MSAYVPRHEREPYKTDLPTPPNGDGERSPHYAAPEEGYTPEPAYDDEDRGVGPSRKRPRTDGEEEYDRGEEYLPGGHDGQGYNAADEQGYQEAGPSIEPSIFGIAPRNPVTKVIGEFIMQNAQGKEHVEIEIKLGTIQGVASGAEPPRRVRLPSMTEMVIPPDYPTGSFFSNMTKQQNQSINRLMNQAAEASQQTPFPIKFYRAQQTDSFFNIPSSFRGGGKVRVSRDRTGNVIPDGIVRKARVGNMNVYSPGEVFDWRVSVNVEEPVEMPKGDPVMTRQKDRVCYRHQMCQVDLTVVTARDNERGQPSVSYELEIEVLDVPALLAEGEKEAQGLPNVFDDMLQSVLDTARMIIRNVDP